MMSYAASTFMPSTSCHGGEAKHFETFYEFDVLEVLTKITFSSRIVFYALVATNVSLLEVLTFSSRIVFYELVATKFR